MNEPLSRFNTPVVESPHNFPADTPLRESPSDGSQGAHSDNARPGDVEESEKKVPPHRHLFHCYIYQYHLMHLAGDVVEMVCPFLKSQTFNSHVDQILKLNEILRLEQEHPWPTYHLRTPVKHAFKWNRGLLAEQPQQDDDDDDPGMFYYFPFSNLKTDPILIMCRCYSRPSNRTPGSCSVRQI